MNRLKINELAKGIFDLVFPKGRKYKERVWFPFHYEGNDCKIEIGYFGNNMNFECRFHFPYEYVFAVDDDEKTNTVKNITLSDINKVNHSLEIYLAEAHKKLLLLWKIKDYLEVIQKGKYPNYHFMDSNYNIGYLSLELVEQENNSFYRMNIKNEKVINFSGEDFLNKSKLFSFDELHSNVISALKMYVLEDMVFDLECVLNKNQDYQELLTELSALKVKKRFCSDEVCSDGRVVVNFEFNGEIAGDFMSDKAEFILSENGNYIVKFKVGSRMVETGLLSPKDAVAKLEELLEMLRQEHSLKTKIGNFFNKDKFVS